VLLIQYLHFLLTLKPNADGTAQKTKNLFCKCALESHFTSISGLGGAILSKKSLYPNALILKSPSCNVYCILTSPDVSVYLDVEYVSAVSLKVG
jgi:hypothetical protein